MSAPYHNVEEKLENAIAAYLAANLPTYGASLPTALKNCTFKKGMDFDETEPPFVSVACPSMEAAVPESPGSYAALVIVAIITTKSTSRDDHSAFVGRVTDLLYDGPALTAINTAATGISVSQLIPTNKARRSVIDSMRKTEREFIFRVKPI